MTGLAGSFQPSLDADAKRYGVEVTRVPYPPGVAGVKLSLNEMSKRIREGSLAPSVRAFAEAIVRNWAKVAPSRQIGDREVAQIFLDYVRENVRYRYDPDNAEWTQSAAVTLCVPGAPMCIPVEDCDGLSVALGSLMGAYGMEIRIMKQSFGAENPEHVLIVFKDGQNGWLAADPSAVGKPVGWRAQAKDEVIVNPADPEAVFVGVGRIGRVYVGLGRIGSVGSLDPTQAVAQVLVFRKLWDPYVIGVAQAATTCAAAWRAAASSGGSSGINVSQFARTPDATTLGLWATAQEQNAANIMTMWNTYAGLLETNEGALQMVTIADQMLAFYQRVVLQVGQFYAPEVTRDCPSIALPAVPSFSAQGQVIASIEAAGIVARGVLGFLGVGASGALEFYKQAGQTAQNVVDRTSQQIPWVAGAVIAVAVAGVAIETLPLLAAGRQAGGRIRQAATEARRLIRRGRRRRR